MPMRGPAPRKDLRSIWLKGTDALKAWPPTSPTRRDSYVAVNVRLEFGNTETEIDLRAAEEVITRAEIHLPVSFLQIRLRRTQLRSR